MSELSVGGASVPTELRAEVAAAIHTGGFGFENHHRNARIAAQLATSGKEGTLPRAKLTGTTICGCVYKDGVVLGADTRATGGTEVVDKNCEKIHYLAPNIYCCGAGTAADTEKTTEMISGQARQDRARLLGEQGKPRGLVRSSGSCWAGKAKFHGS